MGLFDHFPYTNVHELNLDWVLSMMKALEAEWEQFTAGNSLTFADPLQHDVTKTYAKNTIVLDANGDAYVSLQAVPVGVGLQNGDYWLMVFDYEAFIEKVNKNFTARYYRGSYRATAAMAIEDWLTVDDVLCKATAAIAADDVLEIGVNIEHFTLEDFIKAFMQSATQMIQQYKNDIDASELQYRQQLAQDIANTTAALQAQLDAAISGVTVDSEVINARVGADGVTYPTLGDAIRTQFDNVSEQIVMNSGSTPNTYARSLFKKVKIFNADPAENYCFKSYRRNHLVDGSYLNQLFLYRNSDNVAVAMYHGEGTVTSNTLLLTPVNNSGISALVEIDTTTASGSEYTFSNTADATIQKKCYDVGNCDRYFGYFNSDDTYGGDNGYAHTGKYSYNWINFIRYLKIKGDPTHEYFISVVGGTSRIFKIGVTGYAPMASYVTSVSGTDLERFNFIAPDGAEIDIVVYWPYLDQRNYYSLDYAATGFNNEIALISEPINSYRAMPLPSRIYTEQNLELNVYYDNLYEIKEDKLIVFETKGKKLDECCRFKVNTAGTSSFQIDRYYNNDQLKDSKSATVYTADASARSGVKKALFIGDSVTYQGYFLKQLIDNYPNDVTSIESIGTTPTMIYPDIMCEAWGGWRVEDYFKPVYGGHTNPFYDTVDLTFDFSYYMANSGVDDPEYVFISLGINDMAGIRYTNDVDTIIGSAVTYLEAMITSIHDYDPDIKVVINLIPAPAAGEGGYPDSHDVSPNTMRTEWISRRNYIIWNNAMITAFDSRYAEKIFVLGTNSCMDTVHNVVQTTENANSRTTKTVIRRDNTNHPQLEGGAQIADCIFSFIKNI